MEERVILVTEEDEEIGTMEKMQAHREGRLHRAFSVFILNDAGEMLLQRRATDKYHSPGLWTNACCSHPRPGEDVEAAAHRRLQEELNFDAALERLEPMLYHADVGGGLIEHEYDHLFVGQHSAAISPSRAEVCETRYVSTAALRAWMNEKPEEFTVWFHLAAPRILADEEITAKTQRR